MGQIYHPQTDVTKIDRPRCGALTRTGSLCKAKAVRGRMRCRLHGGLSTGAKTAEGLERIREAQKKRWAQYRDESIKSDNNSTDL